MGSDPENPRVILLISGKRKCGKDFITGQLKFRLGYECNILRISEPIKKYYAEKCGISLEELLSDGPLKEKYRLEMIIWGEKMRSEDPGYFCRIACKNSSRTPIWIVSDIRRKTDIEYFKKTYGYKIRTVRINVNETVRQSRGWIYKQGVDDAESECDLDDFNNWDLEITNDGCDDGNNLQKILALLKF
ncbi:hypothetical protein HHI36_002318 [Cryptolaemus montrouzieri]|uniref:Phosphomevalonate kinase n=1 Tax=Cryptolaemus montrouzieri TaxID=559131 RepID=A0ABD2PAS2_9CUCU